MQTQPNISIDGSARDGLAMVLDTLLPGTEKLPSGRAVEANRVLLDKVLAADSTLEPVVTKVGQLASAVSTCTFGDIAKWAGEDLERFVFALNAAYYMSKDVRSALGYPGQGRRPISLATPDEIASDDLVAPVIARGPIYVPTPE